MVQKLPVGWRAVRHHSGTPGTPVVAEVSRSAYGQSPCFICGKVISVAGFAQYNHKMMHVRRDEMTTKRVEMTGARYTYTYPRFTITEKGARARVARLSDQLSLGERVG